jgi:hypothetical protein
VENKKPANRLGLFEELAGMPVAASVILSLRTLPRVPIISFGAFILPITHCLWPKYKWHAAISARMASKDDSLRVKANAAVDDARVAAHEVVDDAKVAVDTLVDDVKIDAHRASSDAKIKAHEAASDVKKA